METDSNIKRSAAEIRKLKEELKRFRVKGHEYLGERINEETWKRGYIGGIITFLPNFISVRSNSFIFIEINHFYHYSPEYAHTIQITPMQFTCLVYKSHKVMFCTPLNGQHLPGR